MKKLVCMIAVIGLTGCSSDDEGQTVSIFLNSGGPSFSFDNIDWEEDRDNDASHQFENEIEIDDTANDLLYQTEVYDQNTFSYKIPVPGVGPWTVKLHFAEIFHGVDNTNGIGARIFDVDIEDGQAQLENYDIIEKAGGPATAIVETFSGIEVQDDSLTITFTTIQNAAKVSGIKISGSF